MDYKITKAEVMLGDKKIIYLAKDVADMGFHATGAFVVLQKEGGPMVSYWFCPVRLYQEEAVVEVPELVMP